MIVHLQLARLHARGGGTAAPATAEDIDGLAHVLGVPVPSTIRAIYDDHGGEEPDFGQLRLMGPGEAADAVIALREVGVPYDDHELGAFWTDDNGNYVGVFAAGELAGRVFKIDHEEPGPEPCWRSVASFYDALLDARDAGLDWWDLVTDYPREPTDRSIADDALASRLFALHQERPDSPVGRRAVFRALALSSATHETHVVALLRSDDMWIQERAVQILGHWRWEPAIAGLADVVRNGRHNGRTAGIHALKRIGSPAAHAALRALRRDLGEVDAG
jgi:hypothetical protein